MKTLFFILSFVFAAAGLSGQTFYEHYSNGLKNQKKQNWEEAVQCFRKAIDLKEDDGERVRTYGVNFIDYFPNRELGIVYYEMEDFENARLYLERSQAFEPSDRAGAYLLRMGNKGITAQGGAEEKTGGATGKDGRTAEQTGGGTEQAGGGTQQAGKTAEQTGGAAQKAAGGTSLAQGFKVLTEGLAEENKSPEPAGTVVVAAPPKDNTKPSIEVTSPPLLDFRALNPVTNNTKQITITGKVEDASGIYQVVVNGRDASLSGTGEFRANVFLSVGSNKIVIEATDIHQNTQVREFTIVREDLVIAEDELLEEGGKYYGLIIGVSDYIDPLITDLDGLPVQDAELLAKILTANYTFDKEDILLLKNPTRTQILRAFDHLSSTVTKKDNLLIFYAGHGYYDEKTELGYWLPVDAEANYTANWIYNDVLVANLKRIQSKHTLLISDACFSGSIFKTRSLVKDAPLAYQKKYELVSRKAITSGVLKTVPNKSIFLKYLADRLDKNEEVYLSASQLFQSVEIPVANNSPNNPQYGDIQNVGDEGGDFIFIRKR